MSKGTLFVVAGPSGAGKGTVLGQVFATTDNLFYSVSVTTRQPRDGERHGIDYLFYSDRAVLDMIEKNQFLEYAEYVGNIYGTPADAVDAQLEEGKDVVLEIEIVGALQVKQKRPEAVMIFLAPPGFDELERRLRGRGTDTEDVIFRRLAKAREEHRKIREFDYIVINDNISEAADELRAIIIASRCKAGKRLNTLSGY